MSLEFLDRAVMSCAAAFWPWFVGLMSNITLLLVGVAVAGVLLGPRRAPLRHLLTSMGLLGVLLLPVLNLLVSWEWGLSAVARASWSVLPETLPFLFQRPEGANLGRLLFTVWGLGAALVLGRLFGDRFLLFWHARRHGLPAPDHTARRAANLARRLGIRRPVRVLHTVALDIPCTWGLLRPVILMPRTALAWSEERTKAVLLHELGHVRRLDGLFMAVSRITCAIYWFHPLAWLLERSAREDAERACDSLVVAEGMPPERYARHLLEIIRDARRGTPSLASPMAGHSHVARRITALVSGRPGAARLGGAALALVLLGIVVPTVLLANVSVPGVIVVDPERDAGDCRDEVPAIETPVRLEPDCLQSVDPEMLQGGFSPLADPAPSWAPILPSEPEPGCQPSTRLFPDPQDSQP